jgi:hypothetical protein
MARRAIRKIVLHLWLPKPIFDACPVESSTDISWDAMQKPQISMMLWCNIGGVSFAEGAPLVAADLTSDGPTYGCP